MLSAFLLVLCVTLLCALIALAPVVLMGKALEQFFQLIEIAGGTQ